MKRMLKSVLMAVLILGCTVGLCFAANGNGDGDGDGPIHDVTQGTPFTMTGSVIAMVPGAGLVLATEDGNESIYGIGPESFWSSVGVARPAVGDSITVVGYTVDYNGDLRNIAMSITIVTDSGSITVQLRDAETGLPLW